MARVIEIFRARDNQKYGAVKLIVLDAHGELEGADI